MNETLVIIPFILGRLTSPWIAIGLAILLGTQLGLIVMATMIECCLIV